MRRLRKRQNPHSEFLAVAGGLLGLTITIDLLMHPEIVNSTVLWLLCVLTIVLTLLALYFGKKIPLSIGLGAVLLFSGVSFYFLSPWGDIQTAVSTVQELPILALYLGWFVPRPYGRILLLLAMLLFGISMALNPSFAPEGELGIPTAVQALTIALLSFEIGSVLWRKSERQMTIDPLTQVLNRAGFMRKFERLLVFTRRTNTPMSLVVIDFDSFKQLNDSQGHAAGDQALVDTVHSWRAGLRNADVLARTGGDEFAILLDRTDATEAQSVMQRLRAASPHAWTWGIAQVRMNDSAEQLFARADSQLYQQKARKGRDG